MDNVQAFPIYTDRDQIEQKGMTLRDYFAAAAIQTWSGSYIKDASLEYLATTAYKLADAMLKARES